MFSFRERAQAIDDALGLPFDLVIIGGGVVGCSIAAHASVLGLRCALVEREDFGAGASGNSTGLAHAGLRYLAQGRVGYVFRESRERRRLERLAPHWVRPFEFLFPVYRGDPFPLWQVLAGTVLYELLADIDALAARARLPKRHRTMSPRALREQVPLLKPEGLQGGTEYFVDSQLLDSRFTLGFAQKAAAQGAVLLTHAEVVGVDRISSDIQTVRCLDRMLRKPFALQGRLVVNAAGAWIDQIRAMTGLSEPLLRRSQGVHLVVDRLAERPLIFSTPVKGRVFFVLPTGQDASLVGTTDTPQTVPPDSAEPSSAEVNELVSYLFCFFQLPSRGFTPESYVRKQIRDVYWAQRPLLRQSGSTAEASREHRLVQEFPFFWSVPGVKLTAGRAVGEEVARAAFRRLRGERPGASDLGTLPGGEFSSFEGLVAGLTRDFPGFPGETLSYLARSYGSYASQVLALAISDSRLKASVMAGQPWILAEAVYGAREEMVLTLNDLLWRRTKWAHLAALPAESIQRLSEALGEELHWTETHRQQQRDDFHREEQRHRWKG